MANNITPTIVNLNTVVTRAPAPSQLQQSGAIPSTGGTTLATGTYQFCGQLSDVTALLPAALTLDSLSWATGTVTATAAAAIGLATGQTFTVIIAGATPVGYNGTFKATVTGADTFTYQIATNPGTETAPGTYTPPSAGFVIDAATTYFAQGNAVGVYLLELGAQTTAADGITALQAWITGHASPQVFYAYLLPGDWDGAALATMTENYSSPNGQTYFFVTSSVANISLYDGNKAVVALVPSPAQAASEHQAASAFYQWLVNNPGPANRLAPMSYRFLFGVTPWPQQGNAANIGTILSAFGNIVLTGAEGGISTACLFKGTTMDGTQASQWFGIDWFRINVKQALAAGIINGSNQNPPLLYDQPGVNTLLAIAERIANNAVAYGCAQSVTVEAVPFATYVTQNPADYAAGIYNGLSATLVGQNGFLTITFFLDAVQFVS
jgi:hypothetical protein